jgi:hypothetical protein
MPEVPAASPAEVDRSVRYVSDEELINRFTYHAPSGAARELHEGARAMFRDVALHLNQLLPEGRSKSLAFTALEDTSFHVHAAIAREPSLHDEQQPD